MTNARLNEIARCAIQDADHLRSALIQCRQALQDACELLPDGIDVTPALKNGLDNADKALSR